MNKKHSSVKKYAFTLVELIFVAMIISLIMPEMFSLYNFIIKSNREIIARQSAIQQGYEFFERLNILMEDYTIDYEEYYNRQMVGCLDLGNQTLRGTAFKRNVGLSGYCTNFTAYGNENSNLTSHPEYNDIYYCSSTKNVLGGEGVTKVVQGGKPHQGGAGNCGKLKGKQSYGQYAALFTDVKGGDGTTVGTADDEELGFLYNTSVDAIADSDNIQELYLISHDGDKRLYFRRKLDKEEDEYKQYKIQMLRLRGFDAGRKHDFDDVTSDNKGIYDSVIDTWTCDTSMGFIGKGKSIGGAYGEYHLPADVDDCWLDLTHGTTDLFAWNISISPIGDADLYWAKPEKQINPYMKIFIINKIYVPSIVGNHRRMSNTINEFTVPLETTINMKDFYKANY